MQFAVLFVVLGVWSSVSGHGVFRLDNLNPPVQHCNAHIGYNRCFSCEEGYQIVNYPDGTQKCIACKSGVAHCYWCADDGTTCQRCKDGYRMVVQKNGKKSCKKCRSSAGKHCYTCSSDLAQCIECNGEYYLTKKGCTICPGAERRSDRYQNAIDKQCNPTYSGDEVNGMTCNPGYRFLDDGVTRVCKPCKPKHCDTCTENRKTCTYCKPGYTLSGDGGCTMCTEDHCFSCDNDADTCLHCETGYWLTPEGSCQKCPNNCRICGDTHPTCQYCEDGYGFDSQGQCTPCQTSKCAYCKDDYRSCVFCKPGFDYQANITACV